MVLVIFSHFFSVVSHKCVLHVHACMHRRKLNIFHVRVSRGSAKPYKDKTNHPISSKSHPSATGGGATKRTGTSYNLDKV